MTQGRPAFYDADDRKWYFEEDLGAIHEFEELLESHDLSLQSGSSLEDACFEIVKVVEASKNQVDLDPSKDYRDMWRVTAGLTDFVSKILSVKSHPEFEELIPHLELLMEPDAGIVQNMKSAPTDQTAHKVFELYVAVTAMRVGDNIELEDPDRSSGNNPDVMFDYENQKWGVACKMMNTENYQTYRNRLEEGVEQIEKSPSERGFVCMSLKNVTSHDVMMPIHNSKKHTTTGHFSSVRGAAERLRLENPFSDPNVVKSEWPERKNMLDTFSGKKASRLCVEYQSTIVGIRGVCSILRMLTARRLDHLQDDTCRLLKAFNDSIHDIDSRLTHF